MTVAFPSHRKRAFITGITGQDGSYLAELLISKNYEVHGIKRRSSSFNTERVDHLISDWHERDVGFFLHFGDLSDATGLSKLLYRIAPDEIYHLGAQSHVGVSFDIPEYGGEAVNLGSDIEVPIHELARKIARVTGSNGRIQWDPSYPEGTTRRVLDVARAQKEFGFRARRGLAEGLV